MDPDVPRKMFRTLEPYASVVYLVPEAEPAYVAVGLRPGRMRYFASRAAPMGAVAAEVVVATFFSFQPDLIHAVIPEAWDLATPGAILGARVRIVDVALRRILGDAVVESAEVAEAAGLARAAATGCRPDARAFNAGCASLPWPGEPHLDLWHALTLLREFRGDGHVASLVVAGNSGCEAAVMHVAAGGLTREFARTRGWSDDEWSAAVDRMRSRSWLDVDGNLTEAGSSSRQWVEDRTDELASPPWEVLGNDGCQQLRELVRPLSRTISDVALGDLRGGLRN